MNSLPDPAVLSWIEADEYARIIHQAACELRALGENSAARILDNRALMMTHRRNALSEVGR